MTDTGFLYNSSGVKNGGKMTTIIGIKVKNRLESAVAVQEILTKYGCIIKTRIGLHKEINGECSPEGLILLEITDDVQAVEIPLFFFS